MKSRIRVGLALIGLAVLGPLAGCETDGEAGLDVRTFQLQYIEPAAANRIIDPYVFADRGGMVSIDQESGLITVRETSEMLVRIEEVLAKYDQPEPSIRLHFRLIQANGGGEPDPALQEIEEALPKEIFRFRNYRQIAEAVLAGLEWGDFGQQVYGGTTGYYINGQIGEVRAVGDSGTVTLVVRLHTDTGPVFETSVNARLGQLLVLGTGQPAPGSGALILAVRAELDRP